MAFDGDWGSSTVLEERRMARTARFPIPADYRALSGAQDRTTPHEIATNPGVRR
jgi:hypothetical protein